MSTRLITELPKFTRDAYLRESGHETTRLAVQANAKLTNLEPKLEPKLARADVSITVHVGGIVRHTYHSFSLVVCLSNRSVVYLETTHVAGKLRPPK